MTLGIYAVNCVPGELQMYGSLYRTMSKDIKELFDDAVHSQVCFPYFNEIYI